MSMTFMRAVRDFNQLTYAAKTISRLQATKYSVTITHSGLGRSKTIRGPSKEYVSQEATKLYALWDATWQNQRVAAASRAQRESIRRTAEQKAAYIVTKKLEQERLTANSAEHIAQAEGILANFGEFSETTVWDALDPNPKFNIRKPVTVDLGPLPLLKAMETKPEKGEPKYEIQSLIRANRIEPPPIQPTLRPVGLIGTILGKQSKAKAEFEIAQTKWEERQRKYQADLSDKIETIILSDLRDWEIKVKSKQEQYDAEIRTREEAEVKQARELESWTHRQQTWDSSVGALRSTIINCRDGYLKAVPIAAADYFSVMLGYSKRPAWVPLEWTVQYNAEGRNLELYYHLPIIGEIPSIAGYSYVQRDDIFVEVKIKKAQLDALYDSVIYQLVLRCIHDIFKSDTQSILMGVGFNGYVNTTNKATGLEEEVQILYAKFDKQLFEQLNLANVEPGACFTAFQGATTSKPHLLKKIASPNAIPQVDDHSENTVVRSFGKLAQIAAFRDETTLSRILANDKEPLWEYKLSVELLRSKLAKFSSAIIPVVSDSRYGQASDTAFLTVISDALTHIGDSVNQISEIISDEMMPSWGAPGCPGDELRILDATNQLVFKLQNILEVESAVFALKCSAKFLEIVNSFVGVTHLIHKQCLEIPEAIDEVVTKNCVSSGETVELKIALSLSEFTHKVSRLLDKLAIS